eukprot:Sspe_Gene.88332::Locus_60367_Transcript_1_1_Confidence_1.000_Length_1032::g.88332::m.88332/K00074/paaH, hbd, fadB, mmgB; 3-hydroxybutyryl-CoA dehydrogenase
MIIAVIGSGMMGRGIAACAANGGSDVRLYDTNQKQLHEGVKAASGLQQFLSDAGLGASSQGVITAAGSLHEAVKEATFVFEAIIEDMGIKNKLFREIEVLCPSSCILCTNTSSLSVTGIAKGLRTPERFMAAHFIGPAHLVPLVELCPAKGTNPKAVQSVHDYLTSIGKKPVVLKKEIQGFLAARLQAALYREAMHLVLEGVAEPQAVDDAVVNGFGRRLNQIGPFTVGDFAGVDLIQKTHATFFPQLGAYKRDVRSDQLVAKGRCGVKNGKGNYEWPAEKAKEVAARRDAELLRRLKEDFKAKSKL